MAEKKTKATFESDSELLAQGLASVPVAVLRDKGLKPMDRIVYAIICSYAWGKKDWSNPSQTTIAKDAGCGRRSVVGAIAALKARGYLDTIKGGDGATNRYIIRTKSRSAATCATEKADAQPQVVQTRNPEQPLNYISEQGSEQVKPAPKGPAPLFLFWEDFYKDLDRIFPSISGNSWKPAEGKPGEAQRSKEFGQLKQAQARYDLEDLTTLKAWYLDPKAQGAKAAPFWKKAGTAPSFGNFIGLLKKIEEFITAEKGDHRWAA